jgi:TPP-dependent 2-oxoacid decarboxylase
MDKHFGEGYARLGYAGRAGGRGRRASSPSSRHNRRRFSPIHRSGHGQFGRLGLKPIVFVLNNSGYLIERLLCKDPAIAYNDLAPWRYTELPHALGCNDWLTLRVTTCAELDAALAQASRGSVGVYIEVVTDKYAASPLALRLHDSMKTLYG